MTYTEKYLYTPSVKDDDAINFYFCFPAPYSIGMSSLGYLANFFKVDQKNYVRPHRVYTDTPEFKPKQDSILAFSLTFEIDILGIFKILENLKIPLKKEDRDSNHPLVFAGGAVATANPEPFVDFFDFFILGDGEQLLAKVLKECKDIKHKDRKSQLLDLSQIPGVYVPEFYDVSYNEDFTIKQIERNSIDVPEKISRNIHSFDNDCCYTPILTDKTTFSNTLLLEVERGCSQKCFFCVASKINSPVRYPSKELLFNAIDHGLNFTRKIGLLGPLITDHPDLEEVMQYIYNYHQIEPIKLTTSSLRADNISSTMARILHECDQRKVTISIEAGSQRLRDKINKKLSNDQIIQCFETLTSNDINKIKIYLMIGLPDEKMEDIQELIDLIKTIKHKFNHMEITLSINSFIPKAHTAFERVALEEKEILQEKMEFIKKHLHKNAKIILSSVKWDKLQTTISRGDRRLGDLLLLFYNYGGTLGSFNRAFKNSENIVDKQNWFTNRLRTTSEVLPWDHLII